MSEETITNIIVALISFLGGIVSVISTSRLTAQSEKRKYQIERYQKVFSPVYLDIIAFADIFAHGSDPYDSKQMERFHKIEQHIEKNLVNIPVLSNPYHAYARQDEIYSAGRFPDYMGLKLLLAFLNELDYETRRLPLSRKDRHDINTIRKYRILYLYWMLWYMIQNSPHIEYMLSPVLERSFDNERQYKALAKIWNLTCKQSIDKGKAIKLIANALTPQSDTRVFMGQMADRLITEGKHLNLEQGGMHNPFIPKDAELIEEVVQSLVSVIQELRPKVETERAKRFAQLILYQDGKYTPRFGYQGEFDKDAIDSCLRVCEWREEYLSSI